MKPWTCQRIVAMTFDFPDAGLEQEILIGETAIDADLAKLLVQLADVLHALKENDLEAAASTRLLIAVNR